MMVSRLFRVLWVVGFVVLLLLLPVTLVSADSVPLDFTVQIAFAPGKCVVGPNGYGGSDSFPYTAPVDGEYILDDLDVHGNPDPYSDHWAIVPADFDPDASVQDQALGSNQIGPAELKEGQEVVVILFDNGGYGNNEASCEADGFSHNVSGTIRLVGGGESSSGPVVGAPCSNLHDGRINNSQALDCAAPVAIYLTETRLVIYGIHPQTGTGIEAVAIPLSDLEAGDVPTDQHTLLAQSVSGATGKIVSVYLLTSGEILLSTQYADGKPYTVAWTLDNPGGMVVLEA